MEILLIVNFVKKNTNLFFVCDLFIVTQKEMIPQPGSLIAEVYSWKSLAMGQPILRLHTTATKAALLTLPPG